MSSFDERYKAKKKLLINKYVSYAASLQSFQLSVIGRVVVVGDAVV